MTALHSLRLSAILLAATVCSVLTAEEIPVWAFPVNPPSVAHPAPDDGTKLHVPDSSLVFTRTQLATISGPVSDWHPDEHPAMPRTVALGRPPQVYACGYCHLPNGAGRPENASLAGLTAVYIKQAMLAFKRGERHGSAPARLPETAMMALAKAATEAEVDEAAAYFASVKPAAFVKVIETAVVPKTVVAGWMLARTTDGEMEPIGDRIVELADDPDRFERRDSRTTFSAFVPPGAVRRGAELVATAAGGRSQLCVTCHGPELRGTVDAPRLAGRSPSYLARQLIDFRNGTRAGGNSASMKTVVANLTSGDIVALAAYLASCAP